MWFGEPHPFPEYHIEHVGTTKIWMVIVHTKDNLILWNLVH